MDDFLTRYFRTQRLVPLQVEDLGPVGEDVIRAFRARDFTVSGTRLAGGGWHISLYNGDWFKAILGLKTALNVTIEPVEGGTRVTAGVGIFELQALPTVIAVFVFAPVVLGQIWGVLQQQKLDEEAVQLVEDRLHFYAGDGASRAAAEEELGPGPSFSI